MDNEFSKTILYLNPKLIAKVNFYAIFTLSIIFDLVPRAPSYLSPNPNSFIDIFIFKPSFNFVTLGLLLFARITLTEPDIRHRRYLRKPILRIFISWVLFVAVTVVINLLSILLGECQDHPEFHNQELECTLAGHHWNGFRISGHTFSLLYSILITLEETYVFRRWEVRMRLFIKMADMEIATTPTPTYTDHLLTDLYATCLGQFRKVEPYVRTTHTVLAVWVIVAEVYLFITVVYFDTALLKILGALLAIGLWSVTYNTIFKIELDYEADRYECMPSTNLLEFIARPNPPKQFPSIGSFKEVPHTTSYGTLYVSPTLAEIWRDQDSRSKDTTNGQSAAEPLRVTDEEAIEAEEMVEEKSRREEIFEHKKNKNLRSSLSSEVLSD